MNIITFTEGLHEQVRTMANSTPDREPLAHASQMTSFIKELLHDLQQFTHSYTFTSPQEEIQFFKETKPVLLSQYFYYKKRFDLVLFDSFQQYSKKKQYYLAELDKLKVFTRKHEDFVRYCMSGHTHFDDAYFMRNHKLFSGLIDTRFSTGYDEKLAHVLANELIRKHLMDLIDKIDLPVSSELVWTGNKTDAVELLVALHALGTINNGELDLKRFVRNFEQCFNVQFGNFYDFIKNIRARKGGRSNFLDTLKEKFLQRLDQMET